MKTMKCLLVAFVAWMLLPGYNCMGNVPHRRVYVSSSAGSDANDGLSEATPVRTIKEAQAKGDTVFLKSGDVFYETLNVQCGIVSKYGGDRLPVLCGYKRIVEPCWENLGGNLWRISLSDGNYSGFDAKESLDLNNIGCLREYDKDLLHGRKLQYKEQLAEDWDIWQTEHHTRTDVTAQDFDSLYLYLSQDPNGLKIEFSVGCVAATVSDATIEDIRIEGFGFGIVAKTHSVVKGCEIDAIGGKIQITESEYICYGNGIEFWVSQDIEDCLVENNTITRCYDCGATIQGSRGGRATPRNIIVRGNLIAECCEGWEDFLRNDDDVVYENCRFENNVLLNNGRTSGFGYPDNRFKYCHVLGNNFSGNKGMIIRNNLFVGGNYYCSGAYNGEYKSNVWENNTCIIKRGDFILGNYGGTKDVIRIPVEKGGFRSLEAATDDAVRQYRELTGDETTKFVIKDGRYIDKKIKKLRKKYSKR